MHGDRDVARVEQGDLIRRAVRFRQRAATKSGEVSRASKRLERPRKSLNLSQSRSPSSARKDSRPRAVRRGPTRAFSASPRRQISSSDARTADAHSPCWAEVKQPNDVDHVAAGGGLLILPPANDQLAPAPRRAGRGGGRRRRRGGKWLSTTVRAFAGMVVTTVGSTDFDATSPSLATAATSSATNGERVESVKGAVYCGRTWTR